jgi:hypothetical protein
VLDRRPVLPLRPLVEVLVRSCVRLLLVMLEVMRGMGGGLAVEVVSSCSMAAVGRSAVRKS